MKYYITHKTQKWVAAITWSDERAQLWLKQFKPNMWVDKTLKASDFIVICK